MSSTGSPPPRPRGSGAASARPPTAQEGAWEAISSGHHALVVAPTGSGKTLSAFLWALDRLAAEPVPEERLKRCRVLYVSPMKALAVDVERNLRSPLVGIRHAAGRLGLTEPDITVAVRSGDTPADERRAFARTPDRRPHHHARVALPPAHLRRPRGAHRCRDGHPRRGPRPRRHQARGAPRPQPRTARRPARAPGAADRPVRHRPSGRGGRPVPRRRPAGRGRAAAVHEGVGPQGRRARCPTWPSSASPPATSPGRPPARSSGRASGRTSRSASSTSSPTTPPPSSSPTAAASPSASPPGSTRSGRNGSRPPTARTRWAPTARRPARPRCGAARPR